MNGARYAYLDRICQMVAAGEDIVIVSSDYAAPSLDKFRVDFPKRYISVGIAEQNLIQVACGLALQGKKVVAYGMAPFPCIRAVDQIRNAAAMMRLPINIVSAGVGFAIPEFGATHFNTEDISIIRTIAGVDIINVTDNMVAQKAADCIVADQGLRYIRFDKYSEGEIYQPDDIDFAKGFSCFGSENCDAVVVSYGFYFSRLLKIKDVLAKEGLKIKVLDLFSIPFNREALYHEIKNDKNILTCEEHVLEGGIGSIIIEFLNDTGLIKQVNLSRMGISFSGNYPDTFGSREYFIDKYGLTDEDIVRAIRKLCGTGAI